MSKKIRGQPGRRRAAAVRAAAAKALASLLQPLAGFVLDSGLSVRELEVLFRTAAVLSVAQRQRASHQRVNISGIAATTGIPRAEISQILRMPERQAQPQLAAPSPISRILSAWYEEPGYQKPDGKPVELKVFGPAPSFEALVKKHGGGLPARAVLDELTRIGALGPVSSQNVRFREISSTKVGSNPCAISGVLSNTGHSFFTRSDRYGESGYENLSHTHQEFFSTEVWSALNEAESSIEQLIRNAGTNAPPYKKGFPKLLISLFLCFEPSGSTNQKKSKEDICRTNLRRSRRS